MRVNFISLSWACVAIAMLALAPVSATAQDTVVTRTPKSTYFCYPAYDMDSTWFLQTHGYRFTPYGGAGKYFCVEPGEELTVYGIAAAMQTYDLDSYIYTYSTGVVDSSSYYGHLHEMADTSHELAYEHWGIYKQVGDALELVSPQLKVNIKTTPVSYYLDMDAYGSMVPLSHKQYIAMYEMYFNEPQTVRDSFYLYMTNHNAFEDPKDDVYYATWPIFWTVVGAIVGESPLEGDSRTFPEPYAICWRFSGDSDLTWYFERRSPNMLLVYPILEPDSTGIHSEDTTGVEPGGDTLSVQESMLWRSTVVLPNPARGEARVVSGVGLTQVEAYDAAGSRMGSWRATGSELRLDVSAWPDGAYVLRLTTPMGQVSKKLIVRR